MGEKYNKRTDCLLPNRIKIGSSQRIAVILVFNRIALKYNLSNINIGDLFLFGLLKIQLYLNKICLGE